jgi:hypothetical protein
MTVEVSGSEILWAVHMSDSDDIVPQPNRLAADQVAGSLAASGLTATVIPLPYSGSAYASALQTGQDQ